MEANGNGLMKGKMVMSLYWAAKPSSSPPQYSSKVVNTSPSTDSFIINRDYATPQPNQKVSLVAPENIGHYSYTKFDDFYGVAADEGVDSKAATYISSVKERFRLE